MFRRILFSAGPESGLQDPQRFFVLTSAEELLQHLGKDRFLRRSGVEMNDPSARPAIAGDVPDMSSYDTVIVGFPIWWGVAPRIIETFLESCDLSGKKIIPFCTSGGSGVGRSDTALHKNVAGDVKWAKGRQINRPNEAEIRRWLNEVL